MNEDALAILHDSLDLSKKTNINVRCWKYIVRKMSTKASPLQPTNKKKATDTVAKHKSNCRLSTEKVQFLIKLCAGMLGSVKHGV